ncbi:MAG: hypothetical protein WD045_07125 [Pirellulaceae bacterium]
MQVVRGSYMANWHLFLLCGMSISTVGCLGGNADNTIPVTGAVTYEGNPLENGKVVLEPVDNTSEKAYAGTIHDGKFEFASTPGRKIVRITSTRPEDPNRLPKSVQQSMEEGLDGPVPVQFIPNQYNRDSELTVEVTTDNANDLVFDLE